MSVVAWVAVGLIGGAAAGARFLLDYEISERASGPFPTGILAVNLLGAFALGLLAGSGLDGQALIVLGGGLIGSFTTFSTLMLDTHRLGSARLPHLAWATSPSPKPRDSLPSPSAAGLSAHERALTGLLRRVRKEAPSRDLADLLALLLGLRYPALTLT